MTEVEEIRIWGIHIKSKPYKDQRCTIFRHPAQNPIGRCKPYRTNFVQSNEKLASEIGQQSLCGIVLRKSKAELLLLKPRWRILIGSSLTLTQLLFNFKVICNIPPFF